MREITLPSNNEENTSTGGYGYKTYTIPDSLKLEDQLKMYCEFVEKIGQRTQKLETKLNDNDSKLDLYNTELKKQSSRNIEIIGVFSAVLALLIIDVNIIKSAQNFLSAISLIVGLTCSMIIFMGIVHKLFSNNDEEEDQKMPFWYKFSIYVLVGLIMLGIASNYFSLDWFKPVKEKVNQSSVSTDAG